MTSFFSFRAPLALLLAGFFLLGHSSTALALSKIGLTARSVTIPQKAPLKTKGKTTVRKDIDIRKLEATIKNNSSIAATGLTIKFFLIGLEDDEKGAVVLDSDTVLKDVAPGESVVVESKPSTAIFIPAYTAWPAKNSKQKPERYKSAGKRFTGYAVQVVSGEEILAESYSSPVLKSVVMAPEPTPKP